MGTLVKQGLIICSIKPAVKVLLVSMEGAFFNEARTYAGGLGVLVGDKLRASLELGLDLNVLTFSYPLGYAKHRIEGKEIFTEPFPWEPKKIFRKFDEIEISTKFGRFGVELLRKGNAILAHVPEIAGRLYIEKSPEERLKKEILLGKIAAELFEKEGFDLLHMEESQTVFSALELFRKFGDAISRRIVFTTHTPLPHGHETWEAKLIENLYELSPGSGKVNLTEMAMKLSAYSNAVSRLHARVMKLSGYSFDYITNGVHFSTWASEELKKLVSSPEELVYFTEDLQEVKEKAREKLVEFVNKNAVKNFEFETDALTIGIARRFTGYKRLTLVLKDLNRLESIASNRPLQIVFAGVAHPNDFEGIKLIREVLEKMEKARYLRMAYFPWYDMELARLIVQGSDIWLNYPREFDEACGTSWMKAMLNGSHLISTKAGAVPEFCMHSINSWLIDKGTDGEQAKMLYAIIKKLLYSFGSKEFYEVPRNAVRTSVHLTARRMMKEYLSVYSKLMP